MNLSNFTNLILDIQLQFVGCIVLNLNNEYWNETLRIYSKENKLT